VTRAEREEIRERIRKAELERQAARLERDRELFKGELKACSRNPGHLVEELSPNRAWCRRCEAERRKLCRQATRERVAA
jgi:hypothetical protein